MGQPLDLVALTDGTNLNYELVRQGRCRWYCKYEQEEIFHAVLEMRAREAKKGLWMAPSPVLPWE